MSYSKEVDQDDTDNYMDLAVDKPTKKNYSNQTVSNENEDNLYGNIIDRDSIYGNL